MAISYAITPPIIGEEPKKSVGHFRPQRVTDVYAVIDVITAEGIATIAEVCRFLDVNRTAFHAWRVAEPTVSQEQDKQLTPLIRILFKKHRRRYGARRIACELRERGHVCSPKKVSKVLKTQGLRAIQPKSFVPKTTDSRHRLGYSPNLLSDSKEPTGINRVWVGDITYIPLDGRTFCYLASLMDLFSRRIVGWHRQRRHDGISGTGSAAIGDQRTATTRGIDSSHRPSRPVCRYRLSSRAASRRNSPVDESS